MLQAGGNWLEGYRFYFLKVDLDKSPPNDKAQKLN